MYFLSHRQFPKIPRGLILLSLVWMMLVVGCTSKESQARKNNGAASGGATSETVPKGSGSNPFANGGHSNSDAVVKTDIQWVSHSKDYGIEYSYWTGLQAGLFAWIETNGGGLGFLDYDRDGWEDLWQPGGGNLTTQREMHAVDHELMQCLGPGKFRSVSAMAGMKPSRCYSFGPHTGDYDQDGFLDVLIPGYGGQQLYRNQGDGTFEDVSAQVGLDSKTWSSNAAWADIDNDGQLDVYITHYCVWTLDGDKPCYSKDGDRETCLVMDYQGEADQLFRQTGEGKFEDVSANVPAMPSRGLGVASCDFDADGDMDFYVANDVQMNLFFENQGNGVFKEVGTRAGVAIGSRSSVDGSMGIAIGDYDGNRMPDFLVTNYQHQYCELYANQGKNYFKLTTRPAGLVALGSRNVCWGTAFIDAEHDGDEDAVVVAGHTEFHPVGSSNHQVAFCLENMDGKRFANLEKAAGPYFEELLPARGLATADIDHDGDLDFAVCLIEEPARILENTSKKRGHYLQIDLVGTQSNRDALGAIVEISANGKRQVRHRFGGGSYSASHQMTLHFGLGQAEHVESLEVKWPSGQRTLLENVAVNQRMLIVEPSP